MRLGVCLAALAACSVHAQDPISTDRPDFTESPVAVPTGRVQLETGATVVRDAGETIGSGPEALIRWSPVPRAALYPS